MLKVKPAGIELIPGDVVRKDTLVLWGWRIKVLRGITSTERALLSIIREYCGEHDGDFYAAPGVEELAEALGCSERTVQRTRDSLVAKGFLQVEYMPGRRRLKGKDYPPGNIYRLLVPFTETLPKSNGRGTIIRLVLRTDTPTTKRKPNLVPESEAETTKAEFNSAKIISFRPEKVSPVPPLDTPLKASTSALLPVKVTSETDKGDTDVIRKVTPVSPEVRSFEGYKEEALKKTASLSEKNEQRVAPTAHKDEQVERTSSPESSKNPNPPPPLPPFADISAAEMPAPLPGEKVHPNGLTLSQMKWLDQRKEEEEERQLARAQAEYQEYCKAEGIEVFAPRAPMPLIVRVYKNITLSRDMAEYALDLPMSEEFMNLKFREWVDHNYKKGIISWNAEDLMMKWKGWCRNAVEFAANKSKRKK